MRLFVLTLFAVVSIGAAEAPRAPVPATGTSASAAPVVGEPVSGPELWPCTGSIPVFNPDACPSPALTVENAKMAPPANCKDRIEQVRDASGQPTLDKTPAAPGQGYMIAAVDKRIDGCAVMQMKGDVNDLRPLPPPNGPARLQPAG